MMYITHYTQNHWAPTTIQLGILYGVIRSVLMEAVDDQVGGQSSLLVVHGNFIEVEILTNLTIKTNRSKENT